MTPSRPENCDAPGGLARLPCGPTTREKAARHTQTDPLLGPLLRRGAGSAPAFTEQSPAREAKSYAAARKEGANGGTMGSPVSTPRVGLEPTTLRLTAGCSAN